MTDETDKGMVRSAMSEGKNAIEQMLGINLDDLVSKGTKTEQNIEWLIKAVQVLDAKISKVLEKIR